MEAEGDRAGAKHEVHAEPGDERFRALLEHSHDVTLVIDRRGLIMYASPALERQFGWATSELQGRVVFDLVHRDDAAALLADFASRASLPGVGELTRYRFRSREGEWRTLEVIGTNLLDHPAVRGLVINARDVTDREAAEERLRRSEQRLETAQRIAKVGDWAWDVERNEITWSKELFRIYGMEPRPGPLRFADFRDRVHPEDFDAIRRSVERSLQSGEPFDFDCRLRRPDGAAVQVHGRADVVRGDDGRIVGMVGTTQDVTEQHRAAEALRASEARMRLFLRQIPATLWMTDAELRLVGGEGFGLHGLALVEEPLAEASLASITADDGGGVVVEAHRAALRGEPVSYETTWKGRSLQAHVEPLRDDGGQIVGVIGVALDVSERRLLEDQLLQSRKIEAVGRLAGGIAHDFNNILAVVLGNARLLLEAGIDDAESAAGVREIAAAAERAAMLTRQLLAFSRRQVFQLRTVELGAVVGRMVTMLRRFLGEDVEVILDADAAGAWARVDPAQLEQVVLNLVVNAREAMPEGGTLRIETAVASDPDFVALAVSDDGRGMSHDVLERLFEPFFTTKDVSGAGLGLATAHGIVEQSGGRIEVESEIGRGSTFRVLLPRALDRAPLPGEADADGAEAAPAPRPARPAAILVVEDEDAVRTLVRRILVRAGYRVLEARGGLEAIGILERNEPLDLVLTDVVMPGMGGRELAGHVARLRPGLRILFTSGYNEDEVLQRGISQENEPFLPKPFSPARLLRKVADVLDPDAASHDCDDGRDSACDDARDAACDAACDTEA